MRTYVNLRESVQIRADTSKSEQITTSRCKLMRIIENLWNSMRIDASHCVPMPIDANQCDSMQINANRWKSMQVGGILDADECNSRQMQATHMSPCAKNDVQFAPLGRTWCSCLNVLVCNGSVEYCLGFHACIWHTVGGTGCMPVCIFAQRLGISLFGIHACVCCFWL